MFVRSLVSIFVVTFAVGLVTGQKPDTRPEPPTPPAVAWSFAGDGSYLGVETQEVTRENFSKLGLRDVRGVVVGKVVENSPAAAAGLQDGDVIVKFNGEPVTSSGKLSRLIGEVSPDHQATVTVIRGGNEQDINVTLGKRPAMKFEQGDFNFATPNIPDFKDFHIDIPDFHFDMPDLKSLDELKAKMPELQEKLENLKNMPQFKELDKLKDWQNMPEFKELDKLKDLQLFNMPQGGDNFVWQAGQGRRIGVSVTDLSDQLAQKFGVSDGLMISEVNNDSPAAKAGLKAGDIITEINGKAVKSDIDLIREINSQKDGDVQLTVVRDGQKQTISVTPEKTKDSGFIYRTDSDGDGGFMPQFAPLAKPAIPASPAAPATPRIPHPTAMSLFHGRII